MAFLLAIVATGMCRADANLICVGLTDWQVAQVLDPDYHVFNSGPATHWRRVDWLGGEEKWTIVFDRDRQSREYRVADFLMTYHPFAATPSWLAALRDAVTPHPAPCAPPAGRGGDGKMGGEQR